MYLAGHIWLVGIDHETCHRLCHNCALSFGERHNQRVSDNAGQYGTESLVPQAHRHLEK